MKEELVSYGSTVTFAEDSGMDSEKVFVNCGGMGGFTTAKAFSDGGGEISVIRKTYRPVV